MKIGYLSASGEIGGAEASLLTLATALRRHCPGFDPFVIVPADGALAQRCRELAIRYEVVGLPGPLQRVGEASPERAARSGLRPLLDLARNGGALAAYLSLVRDTIRREQPDLLHSNGLKMHLIGSLLRVKGKDGRPVPLVGHVHDYIGRRPLTGKLLRPLAGRFRCFVANSESVARDVRICLRTDRVSTIYNAVDTDRFAPWGRVLDLDREANLDRAPEGTIRIGLAATFAKWKGHLTFLRALAKMQHRSRVRGYIIGGPIYRTAGSQFSIEELRSEVAQLGLESIVGFTGLLENTADALRSLDIVVHASTEPEPFGLAIVEGMACAKPVVVSDAGGASELFEDGVTGLGHRPGDVNGLAQKLDLLASDAEMRNPLGQRARESVLQRFQTADMALRFAAAYQSAGLHAARPLATVSAAAQ